MKKTFKNNFFISILLLSFISILTNISAQKSQSVQLKDSIENITPTPSFEEYLILFNQLISLSTEEKEYDMLAYGLISSIYINRKLGDNHSADKAIVEVYNLVEKRKSEILGIRRIYALQYMESLYKTRGNLKASNDLIKAYIELEKEEGSGPDKLAASYLELSASHRTLGNLQDAQEYAKKAIDLYLSLEKSSQELSNNILDIARAYQFMGLVNKDLKKYDDAISNYETSLEYLNDKKLTKNKNAINLKIRGYTRLLKVSNLISDLELSKKAIDKLKILRQKSNYHEYETYELEGNYSLLIEDYSSAINLFRKSLSLAKDQFKNDKAYPIIARLYMNIGDYYEAVDSFDMALSNYQLGLQYFDDSLRLEPINNPKVNEILEAPQALMILDKKAALAAQLYSRTNDHVYEQMAINTYMTAIQLMEHMKSDFINEGSKFYVAEQALPIYNKAIDLLFNRYTQSQSENTINDIFTIMEKNKAGILFENIESKYKLLASSLPQELIDQELNLKNEISYYSKILSQAKISKTESEQNLKNIQDALFTAKESYALNNQKIKKDYPSFYTFKNEINRTINLSEIKSNLSDGEQFLEYYQGEEFLYVFSTTKEKSNLRRVPLSSVKDLVEKYYTSISIPPNKSNSDLENLAANAFTLTNIIIRPEINPDISKISIVTDGVLNNIPFESLVTEKEKPSYLIESVNLSYYYAAKQWNEKSKVENKDDIQLLCLAPEFQETNTSESENARTATTLYNLPFAKEEFDFLKQNFKGKFIGSNSTSKSDLTSNVENYDVIHLATHASMNPNDPLLSQIHFTDGYLTNYDIQNLNVRPELVVLSACNTAAGKIKSGEGLISLSRGFFEAGVKSLQASLWEINDYSAYQLVKSMYSNLKLGKSKSESLRQAKLDYLLEADKLRSHPYYWAGLVQIGDDQPLFDTDSNMLFVYFLIGFILLIFVMLKIKR